MKIMTLAVKALVIWRRRQNLVNTQVTQNTYIRWDIGAFVQRVAVVMLVALLEVLPPGRARQRGHGNRHISSPARCASLRLLQSLQLHLVVMNPQIWRLDVWFPWLALRVTLHVAASTSMCLDYQYKSFVTELSYEGSMGSNASYDWTEIFYPFVAWWYLQYQKKFKIYLIIMSNS